MFLTPEFWVLIAFVLFIASFGKRLFSYIAETLDAHRQKITDQLTETERLQSEALNLLETYKKKHSEAIEQVEKIISFAEKEATEFKQLNEQELKRFMAQKEKALQDRLALEKEEIMTTLRREAVDEALAIVEQVLLKDKNEQKKLIETSLKKIKEASTKVSLP